MALGSRSPGCGSSQGSCQDHAKAPSADDALIAAQLNNPEFMTMPVEEIIAHLNRYRRAADFTDAAVVLAARKRRLAEAEERLGKLRDEEIGLRARIRALQLRLTDIEARARARHGSGISGRDLTQQAGRGHGRGRRREPVPQVGFNSGVQTMFADGEIVDAVEPRMRHSALRAPERLGSALQAKLQITDDGRAGSIKVKEEAHGEEVDCRGVLEDVLRARVTAGKVPKKEEAQGEEEPARATKKTCIRQKGTSFYKWAFNDILKERKELLKNKEVDEESLAKEAAAAASKLLYHRCWGNAPYMPAKDPAEEEDSDDGSQITNKTE